MKQLIILLLALIIVSVLHAQSIAPLPDNEYCPLTEYTFTVTLPAAYVSLNTTGGVQVTQQPTGFNQGNTSFSFKAKFSDVNQTQGFTIAYSGGSYNPVFKKVKSLFYGHCGILTPNQTSINAPLCKVSSSPISFTNVQWENNFENPVLCFGAIADYQYLLPAGWKVNGVSSNGTTWLNGTNAATVTSDLSSGVGSAIQVRAYNTCSSSSSVFYGMSAYIPIIRNPSFVLTALPTAVACGTTTPVTFTVSNPGGITGITGYVWTLGAGNGWLYNGTAAPATISNTSATLTLTPTCGTTLSSVFVNVAAGVNSCNTNTSTISITQPYLSISPAGSFCTSTANYSIAGLPCNAAVSWAVTPAGIITPSTSTSATPTFTKVTNGTITLTAVITNVCGQTSTLTKSIIVGLTPIIVPSFTPGYFNSIPNPPTTIYGTGCFTSTNNAMVFGYGGVTNLTAVPYNSNNYPTVAGNSIAWNYPVGLSSGILRVGYDNGCGHVDQILSITTYCTGYAYTVNPNPASSDVTVATKDVVASRIQTTGVGINGINIYDQRGNLMKQYKYNKTQTANLNVGNLIAGIYFIEVVNASGTERQQLIIQR